MHRSTGPRPDLAVLGKRALAASIQKSPNKLTIHSRIVMVRGMAKTFFNLPGFYEGIRARRIRQSGRLWLVKVISDEDKERGDSWKPYWFVFIRNFDLKKDGACGAKTIGSWRFRREEDAQAKFLELNPFYPPYTPKPPTEAQRAARAAFAQRQKSSKEF